jgi:hypothetical protein
MNFTFTRLFHSSTKGIDTQLDLISRSALKIKGKFIHTRLRRNSWHKHTLIQSGDKFLHLRFSQNYSASSLEIPIKVQVEIICAHGVACISLWNIVRQHDCGLLNFINFISLFHKILFQMSNYIWKIWHKDNEPTYKTNAHNKLYYKKNTSILRKC